MSPGSGQGQGPNNGSRGFPGLPLGCGDTTHSRVPSILPHGISRFRNIPEGPDIGAHGLPAVLLCCTQKDKRSPPALETWRPPRTSGRASGPAAQAQAHGVSCEGNQRAYQRRKPHGSARSHSGHPHAFPHLSRAQRSHRGWARFECQPLSGFPGSYNPPGALGCGQHCRRTPGSAPGALWAAVDLPATC